MKKKKEKEITNTELLKSINRSFNKMEAKMATKDDVKDMATKMDIEGLKDQIHGINNRIDDFVVTRVKYEDLNKLSIRVEKLEKVK